MVVIALLAQLYIMIIIVQVALSWLVAFDIVNSDNEAAKNLSELTQKLTEPVYKPLKKYIPPVANIDITPLVVIIALQVLISITS